MTKHTNRDGYVVISGLRGVRYGQRREHILVVERVLGRSLPPGACVHHVNGVRDDNRPSNLVACQDAAYHSLLHTRARALAECGNANWRRCRYCKRYAPQSEVVRVRRQYCHAECRRDAERHRLRQVYLRRKAQRAANRRPPATTCKRGHALTPDNVYRWPGSTRRACRACARAREERRSLTRVRKKTA